jgi:hypothetical protein
MTLSWRQLERLAAASKDAGELQADITRAAELRNKAAQAFFAAQTKREAQDMYRCLLPPDKLFKKPEFVHKHIATKHADAVALAEDEAVRGLARERFEKEAPKTLLPPVPDYAMPKSRAEFVARNYPHAARGARSPLPGTATPRARTCALL